MNALSIGSTKNAWSKFDKNQQKRFQAFLNILSAKKDFCTTFQPKNFKLPHNDFPDFLLDNDFNFNNQLINNEVVKIKTEYGFSIYLTNNFGLLHILRLFEELASISRKTKALQCFVLIFVERRDPKRLSHNGSYNIIRSTVLNFQHSLVMLNPLLFLAVQPQTNFNIDESVVDEIEIQIDDKTVFLLEKNINFPEKYLHAGIGILTYFASYLKDNYNNKTANVRIEQENSSVRMVIEGTNGDKTIIEKALEEYGKIVSQSAEPTQYVNDPINLIELQNELRMFKFRIESKEDIIALQNNQIESLLNLISNSLSSNAVKNTLQITTNATFSVGNQITNEIGKLSGNLEDLDQEYILKNTEINLAHLLAEIRRLEALSNTNDTEKSETILKSVTKFLGKFREHINSLDPILEKTQKLISTYEKVKEQANKIIELFGITNL